MTKIRALAWTTFQELIRERFFVVGVIVALMLVVLSYLVGNLSLYEAKRILFNLGTLAIELMTISLGVFAGARLVSKEIELRTCQIILTRPLSRSYFLLGKWLGLFLFIMCILVSLSLLVLLLGGESFQKISFLWIVSSIGLKAFLVMSVVFLCSLVLRPILAALVGISVYFLGHSIDDIRFFLKVKVSGLDQDPFIVQILEKIVPRFDLYNWKSFYFLEKSFTEYQVATMFAHFSSWIALLVILSLLVWRKKDLA
jgi:Cu-processing system permease protein